MARQVIERDRLGVLTKIAQGGQGVVYQAPNVTTKFASSMVYKEYKPHTVAEIDFTALAAMPALVEDALSYGQGEQLISIAAWPCALVEQAGSTTGFVMPAIPQDFFVALTTVKGSSTSAAEFQHLLNHPTVLAARGISVDDAQRYSLLRETASGLAFLHKHGVCVGDISPKNLLFSLSPHPAVFFIDCDAMRINGVSALPQVETPGWQVPAGEELATVYSDAYKLGLLALRLLAGDHDTTNPQHLPSTTPDLLRQVITDTLANPPQRRPLPDAWNYVLGNAIEHAQHRQKTAAATPIGAPPAAPPPTPVVHSRPSASTSPSRPPTPPPGPPVWSRPPVPAPQFTPPAWPPAPPVWGRPPVHEGVPAFYKPLPPPAFVRKRPTTTALLIGAIVILVVALALAIGIAVTVTEHEPTAARPTSGATSSAEPTKSTVCEQVSAPMSSIRAHAASEPQLRIPQPPGWQVASTPDSQIIRYTMRNVDLATNAFAPTAVVTLESTRESAADQQKIFGQERAGLYDRLRATSVQTTDTTLCGLKAELVSYDAPAMGRIPPRKCKNLIVIAPFTGGANVATVTVQTTDPDNPGYTRDTQMILTGFQMLPPEGG